MTRDLFSGDSRAVAPAIGFILFIGILVLLLSVYQAQIIPQQNAETELEHHQETRNELRALDNAISAVGSDENPRFETINLGTAYEDRTLGINPPPPAGTIRTEEHNISITNESGTGTQKNISTQFIEYQPGYNELDIGSTWYEHSVLYLDERDRGNNLNVLKDQEIVQDGNVTIVALQNEFEETGTGRITFELYPKNDINNITLPEPDGNYTVEIPTRLNGSEYWNETLGSKNIFNGVNETENNDDSYLLNLTVEPDALELDSVGINLEPESEFVKGERREAADDLEIGKENGLQAGGARGGAGRFDFTLNNTGDENLDVVSLGIVNTSTSADQVDSDVDNRNSAPLVLDREDLISNDTIEFDSDNSEAIRYNFTESVEIESTDETDFFELDTFVDDGDREDMTEENIAITVWVENEDGEESKTTLTLKDEDNGGGGGGGPPGGGGGGPPGGN